MVLCDGYSALILPQGTGAEVFLQTALGAMIQFRLPGASCYGQGVFHAKRFRGLGTSEFTFVKRDRHTVAPHSLTPPAPLCQRSVSGRFFLHRNFGDSPKTPKQLISLKKLLLS
jgi:hypothetical protein